MSSCPYPKSLTDSLTYAYAKCDNPIIGSTNDPHMSNPYRLTRAHCKCQWTTNLESIPTPITQLEVYVLIVCLILGNKTFRIIPRVSNTHTNFPDNISGLSHLYITFRIIPQVSHTQIPSFSPEGINSPFLDPPNTL